MPMISFSGETSRGAFWDLILRGEKTQTCRIPRKRPLEEKTIAMLYWKVRVRKDKKPIHLIGKALITKIERKKYGEFAFDDEFARRDGFRDHVELQDWFGDPSIYGEEEYDVIHFKLL